MFEVTVTKNSKPFFVAKFKPSTREAVDEFLPLFQEMISKFSGNGFSVTITKLEQRSVAMTELIVCDMLFRSKYDREMQGVSKCQK